MQAQRRKIILTAITCLAIGLALGWFLRSAVYHNLILVETEKAVVSSPQTETVQEENASLSPVMSDPGKTSAPDNAKTVVASVMEDVAEEVTSDMEEASGRLDLNSASAMELQTIPGIGEVLSQRIIEYRDANGDFHTVQELMNIKGIGEKTFAKIKDYVEVR